MYVLKRWRKVPLGRRYPAEMAGMLLAHLGVAVFLVGVLLSQALNVQRDVPLHPGQSQAAGPYTFRFDGVKHVEGPNWTAEQGTITVFNKSGEQVTVLHPQNRTYPRGVVQTEAAVDGGVTRDLYVALGNPLDGTGVDDAAGSWSVRLYYKPFVRWIWYGGFLMALGGFVCATDKRFRIRKAKKAEQAAVSDPSDRLPQSATTGEAEASP